MRGLAAAILSLSSLVAALPARAIDGFQVWHQGRQLTVVDQDGWAVYQGDILLGRTPDVLARSLAEGPNGARIGSVEKSVTLGGGGNRWPKNASMAGTS